MASPSGSSSKSKRPPNAENTESAENSGNTKVVRDSRGKRLKKDDSGSNDIRGSDEGSESCSSTQEDDPTTSDLDSALNDLEQQANDTSMEVIDEDNAEVLTDLPSTSNATFNRIPKSSSKKGNEKDKDTEKTSTEAKCKTKETTCDEKPVKSGPQTRSKTKSGSSALPIYSHAFPATDDKKSDTTDSSSDEDEVSQLVKDKKAKEEAIRKYDPTPKTPYPKHKWNATKAVLSRQYGRPHKYSPNLFRSSCYGSMHVVERLELMYKMKKHDGCVNSLHFNSTGTKLATGSDDLNIVIWDWTIAKPLVEYNSGHRSNVFQSKFLPLCNDAVIVSCARDGQVRIGETTPSGPWTSKTRKLAQHKGAAHKLAIQNDSPHSILSCGEDAVVFSIDLRVDKAEKLVVCKSGGVKKVPLYSIFNNPHKTEEFVVAGKDQFVRVYDTRFVNSTQSFLKSYCPKHLVTNDKTNVTSVVYNYNGKEILASYNDEDIYVFDSDKTNDVEYLHRYKGHRNSQTVKGVNYFGPKSEYIISGSDCGYIFFWEKESEHIVKYMYGDEGGVVNCLEPNPIMPVLASSGLDDDIKIWVPSCEEPPDLSGLKNLIVSNMRQRDEEQSSTGGSDVFVEQTIWFLMQHLTRAHMRRRGNTEDDGEELEPDTDSHSSSDSDSDADSNPRPVQCSQS